MTNNPTKATLTVKKKSGDETLTCFVNPTEYTVTITPSGIIVPDVIMRTSVGKPLDSTVQTRMSNLLGRSFDDVRVHDNEHAADVTSQIGAEAVTVGSNIFFAPTRYQPETVSGQALIGHELTHIIQQTNLPSLGGGRMLDNSNENYQHETEAIQTERMIMQHLTSPTPHSNGSSNGASSTSHSGTVSASVQRSYEPSRIVHLQNQPSVVQRVNGANNTTGSSNDTIVESSNGAASPDIDEIAELVMRRLKKQLKIERERFGTRSSTMQF